MTIDLGEGMSDVVIVHEKDNPYDLAI